LLPTNKSIEGMYCFGAGTIIDEASVGGSVTQPCYEILLLPFVLLSPGQHLGFHS